MTDRRAPQAPYGSPPRSGARRALPWLLLLYGAATLAHFAHNAEYLSDYPHLPAWSRAEVYGAWCVVTAIGVAGFVLWSRGLAGGVAVLTLYALLGFAGLLHYTRAPLSHHTVAMNLTIWAEAAGACLVLFGLLKSSREPA